VSTILNIKIRRKRVFRSINRGAQLVSLSILLSASVTQAQIGGPRNIDRAAIGQKEAATTPSTTTSQRFEKEGIGIDFSVTSTPDGQGLNQGLIEGANALVTFRLSDARTGEPLAGLHPTSWISSSVFNHSLNEAECKDRIKYVSGGMLSARADIDLNSFLVLTLNHDNTVSFINPLVSFSQTKLESLISLPGTGADWALSASKDMLYVTLPEQSSVAAIDTVTRKVVTIISTGEKSSPRRIRLDPAGRYLWIGLDGSQKIAVIDSATNKQVSTITVGEGLHNFAFTGDGRFAFVSNSVADTVSAIDIKRLSKVADIRVAKTPVAVAYSSASGLIYAASINGETISAIDPVKLKIVATTEVNRGVVALRFEPTGRYGFAVNQVESTVSVIDAATNRIIGKTPVVREPDQVVFSDNYAYIRGLASEKFTIIELREVAGGKFSPVDIQAGQHPVSDIPEEIGVADMIAPTPDGNSAMIANTLDGMFYYYTEGMMAPMGTFSNYKRRPHALLVLDRSLSEVSPGVYSSHIRLTGAGRFDVPILIDQPRLTKCFELNVSQSPDLKKDQQAVMTVEPLFKKMQFRAGHPVTLDFKIIDSVTRLPVSKLDDVRILVFEPPGVWQQRQWAAEKATGVYSIKQVFPHEGVFDVMIEVASRGIDFSSLPLTAVTVDGDTKGQSEKSSGNGGQDE
jgi:YVTN family beta-propeller protein